MGRLWVLGGTGQLGWSLVEQLGAEARVFSREEADLLRPMQLKGVFDRAADAERVLPKAVINATAYNLVDRAEEPGEKEICSLVNSEAPAAMAGWCARHRIPFVHYSTDYVYSGEGDQPWRETDEPKPLSHYAKSKLAGETAVLSAHPGALVFRTSWVYSHRRSNFVLTVMNRARDFGKLSIVRDQTGSPTWASQLAEMSLQILETGNCPAGVYNLCDEGFVSRLDFTRAILDMASQYEPRLRHTEIVPVTTASFSSPARRPLNTRLSMEKAKRLLGVNPRPWQENLARCLQIHFASRLSAT